MVDRDGEVLAELDSACRMFLRLDHMDGWVRPLDCGGTNGSDHSYRLSKLARMGLAEQRQRSSWGTGQRGSKRYRITEAGRIALADWKTKGT